MSLGSVCVSFSSLPRDCQTRLLLSPLLLSIFPKTDQMQRDAFQTARKRNKPIVVHLSLYLHFYLKTAIWRSQIWKNTIKKNRMSADTCPRSNRTEQNRERTVGCVSISDTCKYVYCIYTYIYIYTVRFYP